MSSHVYASQKKTRAFGHGGFWKTRVKLDLVRALSQRNKRFCRSLSQAAAWLELCRIRVFAHGWAFPEDNEAAGS